MEAEKFRNNGYYLIDSSNNLLFYNASNTNNGQSVSGSRTSCRNSLQEDNVIFRRTSPNSRIDDASINLQSAETINPENQVREAIST